MKRFLSLAAIALAIAAQAGPALADDHHDRDNHRNMQRHAPPPRVAHRYREGQVWHGHRLAYRGGHWGYYQPRNGAQLFINIPI